VLGVCLGHQGWRWCNGGKVRRAPEPMHGRVSEVVHRGGCSQVASPFEAVRYHSLMVAELPSAGGDRLDPRWRVDGHCASRAAAVGVQFHPESVRSAYGRDILANFRELVRVGAA